MPEQEAALKKLKIWRKITVCRFENLSGQSLRNRFSIDWDKYVTGSDSHSKVFNGVPDSLKTVQHSLKGLPPWIVT
jgi:hypothetical protein